MRCSFCIIPATRGAQISRSPEEIVREVDDLTRGGAHEVILTGVQISAYRYGAGPEIRLYDLVRRVLEETSVPRLRLTSLAPWRFDDRLRELFGTDRICRHVHLSLQSGSATTLARMRRPYTPDEYRDLVEALRATTPRLAITTDVIAGFPGETEEEFAESLRFVESIGFARVHAFPYSPRPGTEAAEMPDRVPHTVQRERMQRLLAVARSAERTFRTRSVGEEAEVLWEQRRGEVWQGTTDNYIRAFAAHDGDLAGHATRVRLERLWRGGMEAAPLSPAGGVTAAIPA